MKIYIITTGSETDRQSLTNLYRTIHLTPREEALLFSRDKITLFTSKREWTIDEILAIKDNYIATIEPESKDALMGKIQASFEEYQKVKSSFTAKSNYNDLLKTRTDLMIKHGDLINLYTSKYGKLEDYFK